jgi:hypothetical protein
MFIWMSVIIQGIIKIARNACQVGKKRDELIE